MPDASLSLTAKSSFKGNPEFGQAIVRILIWVTVTALVFIGAYTDYYPGNYLGYSLFSGTFLVVSLFVLYSIGKTPRPRWRVYATIPFDVTSISAVMLLTESGPFSPWFLFYPWIYIGYGVRYGRVELSPFNLEWVVKAVVNIFLPQTDKKGIRLEYQLQAGLPEMVVGDHNRLRQILLNLISNAVKYTDEGYVRLTVHKPDDNADIDTLHFEIKDTGIGIEKNQLQHIFEPFYQCQIDPAEQRHGTGLGTTISSRLVNTMYGTIGANSVYGKGSTFWFNLLLPVVDNPAHTQILPGTGVRLKSRTTIFLLLP